MKILLTTLNSKFIHTNLAIRYLKEFVRDLIEVDMKEYTINNDLDYILKDIYKNEYDIILFSTYIWNIGDIVKLCDNLKKIRPNTKIALGGPEVSYDSYEAMKKYDFVDYILYGEGELIFRDLVLHLKGKKEIKNVDGLVYRQGSEIIANKPMELLQNLDEIPSPYENLNPKEYENRIVYYESSRGCPFNCQYCLSSTIPGLRYFSLDRIKRDLKALIDARVSQIKFIDRTFNANKKVAMEIMDFLMKNDNGYTTYHFEVTAYLIDDKMIEFLADCKEGLFQFEIGVQSTNEKTLDAVGRRDDFKKLSHVVQTVASYRNIHQHLDLIAGLPYEDYESFENSFNDVFNLGIEHLQLGFLKMIKGTGMRKVADEHGFKYKDYAPYEFLYNNYISYEETLKLKDIEDILERYYNSKNFVLSMRYIIGRFYKQSPFKFFETFAKYFDENGYFDLAQGKNQLYKILLDFYNEKINIDNDVFNDILKYDYISLGKTSNIPQFFNKLDVDDFKNRCHVFLQDNDNLSTYLPNFVDKPAKHIIKYVHFEPFKFNIVDLKNNINTEIREEENIVLFEYDDKKIFEKSKTHKVEI
ncbi:MULTISPECIES: B12-binding domain-containing radical SAM protein [unclassified Clostridioides]|uniref:B12-binding domain-containing radical SAM protein n=1 Tax=unclassified Clostridioides TaxID=2635829 RepID=UPI001D1204C9|nr:B12-binding domain-containing radical SAM protein [Clostridioides sp. ZZV14-6154]MCC0668708.1 B12-binding domain-containing radical SAM protein [Clostridioides sp. ZZV14-6153]MCC0717962.1 B12-binding domain-containing radical SAM protein [Clostridioides sp. ZZV14-6105]MCC0721952.1 B12-binding domain-containing radical SAM protein [Clostridioides sp. ZZV14-6104]MCC0726023.1 B12-binding domain-containing radical SAM protein [Clostridioides sp. ZZV14-6045]MCC0731802.1 B12-binding domain-contai